MAPKVEGVAQATKCTRISGQTSPKELRPVGIQYVEVPRPTQHSKCTNITNILFTELYEKYK
jgi:hypothetical protein